MKDDVNVVAGAGILENNMRLLEVRFPGFCGWLREHEDLRGAYTPWQEGEGKTLWLLGDDLRCIDRYDITDEARQNVAHALWMIFGVGAGKALLDLIRSAKPHVLKIFVAEDDPGFWWNLLEHHDCTPLAEDSRVFLMGNPETLRDDLLGSIEDLVLIGAWKETLYITQRGEAEQHTERMKELVNHARDVIFRRLHALGNSAEDTLLGLRQIASNIPAMLRSYDMSSLEGVYTGYPAIVVGAGPSLDKNFRLLHEVQNRALIIATDAVVKKLLDEGITPHFAVCLEREELNYTKYFKGIEHDVRDVVLVPMTVCVPELAGTWNGPFALMFKTQLPLEQWLSRLTRLPQIRAGASVSNICYTLALLLGCRDIAFIGQDLAFGEGGSTHADGAGWDGQTIENFAQLSGKVRKVPGALGGEVLTDNFFHIVRRLFEDSLEADNKALGRVNLVDATEGGALIKGSLVMPFRQFLDEYVLPLQEAFELPSGKLSVVPLASEQRREQLVAELRHVNGALFANYRERLEEIEAAVERMSVPTLGLVQKRRLAGEVGTLLDRLINASSVLTFVIQSLLMGLSAQILSSRRLESREDVHLWQKVHQEFLDSVRVSMEHMEQAFSLCIAFIEKDGEHEAVIESLGFSWGTLSPEQARDLYRYALEKEDMLLFLRLAFHYDSYPAGFSPQELLMSGRIFLERGWIRFARRVFQALITSEEPEARALVHTSSFCNDCGVSYLSYELGADRDIKNAAYYLGKALQFNPENESAVDNFIALEQCIQSTAENFRAIPEMEYERCRILSESFARLRLWEKALPLYQKMLALPLPKEGIIKPSHRLLWETAICYEGLGNMRDAEAHFIKAEEASRDTADAVWYLWELGRFFMRRGDRKQSLRVLDDLAESEEGKKLLLSKKEQILAFAGEGNNEWLQKEFLQRERSLARFL